MAIPARGEEPTWLNEDLWLASEQPQGVADDTPDHDAHDPIEGERIEVARRFGTRELLLALCVFVPQLAWMALLVYLGLRVLT